MEEINVKDLLSYKEKLIAILDRQVWKLRSEEMISVKVLWKNQKAEESTWESEDDMSMRYPTLFETAVMFWKVQILYYCNVLRLPSSRYRCLRS